MSRYYFVCIGIYGPLWPVVSDDKHYSNDSNVTVAPWNNQASDTSTFDRLRDTCNKMFLRDGHLRGSSQFALSPTLPRVSCVISLSLHTYMKSYFFPFEMLSSISSFYFKQHICFGSRPWNAWPSIRGMVSSRLPMSTQRPAIRPLF